ncbi:MAG: hypothetical protein ACJA1A_003525, partial [Saprospiraceae bacterium]
KKSFHPINHLHFLTMVEGHEVLLVLKIVLLMR